MSKKGAPKTKIQCPVCGKEVHPHLMSTHYRKYHPEHTYEKQQKSSKQEVVESKPAVIDQQIPVEQKPSKQELPSDTPSVITTQKPIESKPVKPKTSKSSPTPEPGLKLAANPTAHPKKLPWILREEW